MTAYRKLFASIIVGALTWATAVTTSAPAQITSAEWISFAGIIAASLAVYLAPNTPAA